MFLDLCRTGANPESLGRIAAGGNFLTQLVHELSWYENKT